MRRGFFRKKPRRIRPRLVSSKLVLEILSGHRSRAPLQSTAPRLDQKNEVPASSRPTHFAINVRKDAIINCITATTPLRMIVSL